MRPSTAVLKDDPEHITRFHTSQQDREITDPRIPNRAMAFMRKRGLNEIPQAINVLKGEMSIVGPRPLAMDYIDRAQELFADIMRKWRETALTIKPEIVGVGVSPLSTRGLPIEEFDKLALADIDYYNEATCFRDLSIIAQSIYTTTI